MLLVRQINNTGVILGAEVDGLKRADWTPLMLACTKTGPDAVISVNALLKAGANPIIRNKDGWTPLLLACRTGDVPIIKTLLQQPTVVATTASNNGRTALHIAGKVLIITLPR